MNEQSTGTGTKIPRVRLQEEMRTRQEESGCQYHPLLSSRLYYYRRSVAFHAEGQPPAGRSGLPRLAGSHDTLSRQARVLLIGYERLRTRGSSTSAEFRSSSWIMAEDEKEKPAKTSSASDYLGYLDQVVTNSASPGRIEYRNAFTRDSPVTEQAESFPVGSKTMQPGCRKNWSTLEATLR